jgi:hypothetical protein
MTIDRTMLRLGTLPPESGLRREESGVQREVVLSITSATPLSPIKELTRNRDQVCFGESILQLYLKGTTSLIISATRKSSMCPNSSRAYRGVRLRHPIQHAVLYYGSVSCFYIVCITGIQFTIKRRKIEEWVATCHKRFLRISPAALGINPCTLYSALTTLSHTQRGQMTRKRSSLRLSNSRDHCTDPKARKFMVLGCLRMFPSINAILI